MDDSMVRRIVVDIATSYAEGASTKAPVFLGLGGREFRLAVDPRTDFEHGAEISYQFGEDANVLYAERNDPRVGKPISAADVLEYPAYLRLDPRNDKDDWRVDAVSVRVFLYDERRAIRFSALEGPHETAWLGRQNGLMLHLKRGSLERIPGLQGGAEG